jgi:hypothetical protein
MFIWTSPQVDWIFCFLFHCSPGWPLIHSQSSWLGLLNAGIAYRCMPPSLVLDHIFKILNLRCVGFRDRRPYPFIYRWESQVHLQVCNTVRVSYIIVMEFHLAFDLKVMDPSLLRYTHSKHARDVLSQTSAALICKTEALYKTGSPFPALVFYECCMLGGMCGLWSWLLSVISRPTTPSVWSRLSGITKEHGLKRMGLITTRRHLDNLQ